MLRKIYTGRHSRVIRVKDRDQADALADVAADVVAEVMTEVVTDVTAEGFSSQSI